MKSLPDGPTGSVEGSCKGPRRYSSKDYVRGSQNKSDTEKSLSEYEGSSVYERLSSSVRGMMSPEIRGFLVL